MRLKIPTLLLLSILAAVLGCKPKGTATTTNGPKSNPSPKSPAVQTTKGKQAPVASVGPPSNTFQHFEDVTEQLGLDFTYSNGRNAGEYAILESLGGGVGVFDFDNDGWMDLMFAGGGRLDKQTVTGLPGALYWQQNGKLLDVSQAARLKTGRWYQHGVFPADYDNDGFVDVAISGYGGIQLFHNQGDGTFVEQPWTTPDDSWSTSLAWGDFSGDGALDLYVPHYVDWSWDNHPECFTGNPRRREVCAPRDFHGLDDRIYFALGDGRLEDATKSAGLKAAGKGLGAVAADLDADGDTDIYVANDTTDNFLYLNDGNGVFREEAILNGVSGDDAGVNTGSMGIAVGDSNQDGMLDIWVTNFERELFAMYRNEGQAFFTHTSRSAGLEALGGLYVGFGTTFLDFDHDGDQDLVVTNGHVSYHSKHSPYLQEPLLMENVGNGRYQRVTDAGGYFREVLSGRGVARFDMNNDGWWDLVFHHSEQPARVLRGLPTEQEGSWALIQLTGIHSNRDGIGATVTLQEGSKVTVFSRSGGGSYLSQNDPRKLLVIHGSAADAQIVVRWPTGLEEVFPFPSSGAVTRLYEGSGVEKAPATTDGNP